jgi:ribosomal protein S28E/S33
MKVEFPVGYVDGGTPGRREVGIPCDDEDEAEVVEVLENVGKSKDVTRFSNDGSVEADSRSLVRLVGRQGFMGDLAIHKSI